MPSRGALLKNTAKRLSPPIVWDFARFAVNAVRSRGASAASAGSTVPFLGGEQASTFYDDVYGASEAYRQHYTHSRYYFLWCVIADRLRRQGARAVLDIGCGPGQFAALLRDIGIHDYRGLDFSKTCIEMARRACPQFEFFHGDAFETDLVHTFGYDTVVCTEFLEHVERDLEFLARIRPGVRVYGTVPNAGGRGHVRMFVNCEEVTARYASLFRDFRVDAFLEQQNGVTFFLFEGIKV